MSMRSQSKETDVLPNIGSWVAELASAHSGLDSVVFTPTLQIHSFLLRDSCSSYRQSW